MYKSGTCDTKLAISLKRISLESRAVWRPMLNFGLLFQEQIFHNGYLTHIRRSATKFDSRVWPLTNRNLFPKFRELWSGGLIIPCGDMHQSFTGTLVKWFFDNFPMFADSFSVVSIQCVAWGLGQAFCTSAPHRAVFPCDSMAFLLWLALVAEVVKHYHPNLVDLHNYPAAQAVGKKTTNWNILNRLHLILCIGQMVMLLFMVALWNRADHYIFILWFLLSFFLLSFFPRLISAAAD